MRVVSLVPSATESLTDMGVEPVACTRFCERPDLPHVGGVKNPDIAAIAALAPDLVVVDREENRLEHYEALVAAGLEVEALHVAALGHVEPELTRLASRLGIDWRPEPIPAPPDLPSLVITAGEPGGATRPPLVFVPIWRRPYMTVGAATYGTSLLRHLGAEVAFADRPEPYPVLEAEEIRAANVDLVLAPTEPYEWHRRTPDDLAQFGPSHIVDGQDLFWWGTRTPGAVARMAEKIASLLAREGLSAAH